MVARGLAPVAPLRYLRVVLAALAVIVVLGAVLAGSALAAPDYDGDGHADDDCAPLDPAVHPGAADKPDLAFEDTNCDRIDGDESKAMFVSAAGDDRASGTRMSPLRTVAAGVAAAQAAGADVYIAAGSYESEPAGGVPLADGVSLYGGYEPLTWARSADRVTRIKGSPQALLAEGDTGVALQLLTLEGTPNDSLSAYGLRAIAGADGPSRLALSKVTASGAAASAGANGGQGASFVHIGHSGGAGGAGGCGADVPGQPGTPGEGSGPAAGGADGANAAPVGAPDEAAWPLGSGSSGGDGAPGAGGQGGTGGTGAQGGPFNPNLCGGAGGAGGNGGRSGAGGDGGRNGGGSFGLYIFNSSVVASDSMFAGGDGGAGGHGGIGGNGGAGARGGPGADGRCFAPPGLIPRCASRGQAGSDGLPGGRGGGGGAGIGGPSVGVYQAGPESGFAAGAGMVAANGRGGEGGFPAIGGLPPSGESRAAGGGAARLLRSATAPWESTADFDGDGVGDLDDSCPDVPGSEGGCPVRPAKVSPPAPGPSDPAAGGTATGGGTATAGGAPTIGAAAPARDTTPPSWSISAARTQRTLKTKAIAFTVRPSESFNLTVVARLGKRTLATVKRTLPGGAASKVKMTLRRKALAALRKALHGRSKVSVVLVTTGADSSGNATTSTKKLQLKR